MHHFLSLVMVGALLGLPAAAPSRADVIRRWNEVAVGQAFGNPVRLARVLAIMHAAQHDAVNTADPRYETYVAQVAVPGADAEAAAAAAAHTVLSSFFPDNQAALDGELEASLGNVADGPAEDAGVALGLSVGRAVLDARARDGYDLADPFTPEPGPGVWQPTPPAFAPMLEPQFRNVTPFVLSERTQFLPEPPPALDSAAYTAAFDEVKLVGQDTSTVRTPDQTNLAHFWAEPSVAGWSRIGNVVSSRKGYDLHQTARLLALLNMAMTDGFIVGWYQKEHFAFWRPVTAIQETDPAWLPLRPTPAGPDYPSTHSLLGAAAAEVLRSVAGTDDISFCMVSTTSDPVWKERCWRTFSEAELENAESRVKVGFHFRFAIETGLDVGHKVGVFAVANALRPLPVGGNP